MCVTTPITRRPTRARASLCDVAPGKHILLAVTVKNDGHRFYEYETP